MLLLSHLYTLIKVHKIKTAKELYNFGFEKLVNTNAMDDIMAYLEMCMIDKDKELTAEDLKKFDNHINDMRNELQAAIKRIRDNKI
jgi:hypothetical protein